MGFWIYWVAENFSTSPITGTPHDETVVTVARFPVFRFSLENNSKDFNFLGKDQQSVRRTYEEWKDQAALEFLQNAA